MKTEEENIEYFIECINDDKNPLGYDEVLLWLSELFGNKKLEKATNKYVTKYYRDFEILNELQMLINKIKKDGE
jgi:hypothetical protein